MSTPTEQAFHPRRPDVIDEEFEGEAVLVNLQTGCYFALNSTATALWAAVGAGRTAGSIASSLGLDPVIVAAFLDQLLDEELVASAPADAGPVGGQTLPDGSPEPALQRFTDMQDLLMLDPIHDIDLDGDGWPVAPAQGA